MVSRRSKLKLVCNFLFALNGIYFLLPFFFIENNRKMMSMPFLLNKYYACLIGIHIQYFFFFISRFLWIEFCAERTHLLKIYYVFCREFRFDSMPMVWFCLWKIYYSPLFFRWCVRWQRIKMVRILILSHKYLAVEKRRKRTHHGVDLRSFVLNSTNG